MLRTPFDLKRSLERLSRELSVLKVDVARLRAKNPAFAQSADSEAVSAHINEAEVFWRRQDIEGAWASVHAAQRAAIMGLTSLELEARIIVLGRESSKLPEWRRKAVEDLLKRADPDSVQLAIRLRDENSANIYHKIWLTRDQLEFLVWASVAGLLLSSAIGVFTLLHPTDVPAKWSITMLLRRLCTSSASTA